MTSTSATTLSVTDLNTPLPTISHSAVVAGMNKMRVKIFSGEHMTSESMLKFSMMMQMYQSDMQERASAVQQTMLKQHGDLIAIVKDQRTELVKMGTHMTCMTSTMETMERDSNCPVNTAVRANPMLSAILREFWMHGVNTVNGFTFGIPITLGANNKSYFVFNVVLISGLMRAMRRGGNINMVAVAAAMAPLRDTTVELTADRINEISEMMPTKYYGRLCDRRRRLVLVATDTLARVCKRIFEGVTSPPVPDTLCADDLPCTSRVPSRIITTLDSDNEITIFQPMHTDVLGEDWNRFVAIMNPEDSAETLYEEDGSIKTEPVHITDGFVPHPEFVVDTFAALMQRAEEDEAEAGIDDEEGSEISDEDNDGSGIMKETEFDGILSDEETPSAQDDDASDASEPDDTPTSRLATKKVPIMNSAVPRGKGLMTSGGKSTKRKRDAETEVEDEAPATRTRVS
jgi:hypothetical protein